jgi:1,4-alpha-glucan branching enzyme
VMGRCHRASFQVWSAQYGYPGDGLYREFHKKDENSGMHYWRLTSKETDLGDKMLYDPVMAMQQAKTHADHYAHLLKDLANEYYAETGEQHLMMVSFDTELFGHWWFEGLAWLEHFIECMHTPAHPASSVVSMATAGNYLRQNPPKRAIDLPESTWGQGGHFWVWDNPDTHWMWPEIHAAEATMLKLADQYRNETDSQKIRLLNQLLRELFLLQSSDWPFLVTTVQAKDYAVERFLEHKDNFFALAGLLDSTTTDWSLLDTLEEKNNPFAFIDYRWYATVPNLTQVDWASRKSVAEQGPVSQVLPGALTA